jgi:hypothetical protein
LPLQDCESLWIDTTMTQADRLRQPLLDREDQEVTAGHADHDEVEYEGDFTVGLIEFYTCMSYCLTSLAIISCEPSWSDSW